MLIKKNTIRIPTGYQQSTNSVPAEYQQRTNKVPAATVPQPAWWPAQPGTPIAGPAGATLLVVLGWYSVGTLMVFCWCSVVILLAFTFSFFICLPQ